MPSDLLDRPDHQSRIRRLLRAFPVVAVLGPRQVGKTTLARMLAGDHDAAVHHFDLGARADECFFWATHAGAELDLLVVRGNERRGFELKRTEAPSTTKSMHSAVRDLSLERLDVVHAGRDTFPMAEGIRAVALARLLDDVEPLGG